MVVGKLDSYMQKNKTGLVPHTTKINLKWNEHLNVRPEMVKHLKENIGENLLDFGLGIAFGSQLPSSKFETYILPRIIFIDFSQANKNIWSLRGQEVCLIHIFTTLLLFNRHLWNE